MNKFVSLLTIMLTSVSAQAIEPETLLKTENPKEVIISVISGESKIVGTDEKTVRFTVSQENFTKSCGMDLVEKNGQVTISVKRKSAFKKAECKTNFVFHVPKATNLTLKVNTGTFEVSGMQGNVEGNINFGKLLLNSGIANLKINSNKAKVSAYDVAGTVSANLNAGMLELTYSKPLAGSINIKSNSATTALTLPTETEFSTKFKSLGGKYTTEIKETADAKLTISAVTAKGNLKIIKAE